MKNEIGSQTDIVRAALEKIGFRDDWLAMRLTEVILGDGYALVSTSPQSSRSVKLFRDKFDNKVVFSARMSLVGEQIGAQHVFDEMLYERYRRDPHYLAKVLSRLLSGPIERGAEERIYQSLLADHNFEEGASNVTA